MSWLTRCQFGMRPHCQNYANRFSQGRYWPDYSQGASAREKLLDETTQGNDTCLHRLAPQSEGDLKENKIIKARADQIKTACAEVRSIP